MGNSFSKAVSQAGQTQHPPLAKAPVPREGVENGTSRNDAAGQHHANSAPKPKPDSMKECMATAKARRRQTQLYNKRHPPKPEDIWICEFCEYESIFGRPPGALVRQYEIKDRKQRQLEEQRKAQWERLKKGKYKGRKNTKAPTKTANGQQDNNQPASAPNPPANTANHAYSQGTQSEEYYEGDEDADDGYDSDSAALLVPCDHDCLAAPPHSHLVGRGGGAGARDGHGHGHGHGPGADGHGG